MLFMKASTPLARRHIDVYLVGGVTGHPTWQRTVIAALEDTGLTVVSSHHGPAAATAAGSAVAHLEWERDALLRSRTIVFWFPAETLAPVTLLAFGAALERARRGKVNLVIGTAPGHRRRSDIERYAAAHGHTGVIETSLDALVARVMPSTSLWPRLVFCPSALIE